MKPYIAYSRSEGPEAGAALIIAGTARAARVLAYRSGECWNIDGWLDLAVRWLRDEHVLALADQAKLAAGEPPEPLHCEDCHTWGYEVHAGGVCSNCGQCAGDALAAVAGAWADALTRNDA